MKVEEVLRLLDAGFTKDNIVEMMNEEHQTDPPTEGDTTESGKTESGKTESGKTESGKTESGKTEAGKTESGKTESGKTEASSDQNGMIQNLIKQNNEMLATIKAMQIDNINNARQPETKSMTSGSIIKNFIESM